MEKYPIPKNIHIGNSDSYWMLMNEDIAKISSASDRRQAILDLKNKYIGNTALFYGIASCAQTLRGGIPTLINANNRNFLIEHPTAFVRLIIPFSCVVDNENDELKRESFKLFFKSWMRFIGNMGIHFNYCLDSVEPHFGDNINLTTRCAYYDIPINHPVFGKLDRYSTVILALHALPRYCYNHCFYRLAQEAMQMKNSNPELPEWICLERTMIKEQHAKIHNTTLGLHGSLGIFTYSWSTSDRVQRRNHTSNYGIGNITIPMLNPIRMLRKLTVNTHCNNTYGCYSVSVDLAAGISRSKINNDGRKYELELLEKSFNSKNHLELLDILSEMSVQERITNPNH